MAHFIIRPAGDNDWSNAVFLSGTPPLIAQDATALGLSLGTDYQIGELGALAQFSVTDRPATMEAPSLAVAVTEITVTLPADPATNGKPIIRRDLRHRAEGGTWSEITDVSGSQTLTDLPEAVPHEVQVRAVNDNGPGPWSPSAMATTGSDTTAPAAFANGAWSVADTGTGGAAQITITSLPDDGGSSLTGLQARIDNGPWQVLSGITLGDYTLTGLTNGTTAQIRLRALNAVGAGPASASKTVTTSAPAPDDTTAPVLSTLTLVDGTDTLTVSTDEPGTGYWLVSQNSIETAGNVRTGGALASGTLDVSETGVSSTTVDLSGLTAGLFHIHFMIEDASGNRSAVRSASFSHTGA